ncbi:right-handed parallel beta-helix repeat-containing protein [Snuella sedimenti]|uniref:Right-handed parallel beta-helix repeat-containing protein n=1 Tax=Snuella sedimenti TaxID=2798802 RepID=A0A8J7LS62_9FLAO|nr:right-handed parallel beta-helix repeat-containing protein [Snuella sedimenti]MBJ6368085.1 right-handed parallel beta-helix repeat-containing protein [Snuella sedimenti]
MKHFNFFAPIVFLGFIMICSCDSEPMSLEDQKQKNQEIILSKGKPSKLSTQTYTITNGMTFSDINAVLDQTVSGDTVVVETGTYIISGQLHLKDGIFIRKQSSTTPIFDAQATSSSQMLQQYYTSNTSDIDIFGIQFRNIRFNIQNASNTKFRYCIFDYGVRKSGTDKGYTADAYLQLNNCSNMQVRGCVFKRRNGNSGRGIYSVGNTGTDISNNTFGNGGDTGYFVTAINDNSDGTTISGNTIIRNVAWVNTSETDHGIYAHSFDGLSIVGNTISGWPANSSGGAIKARNGQNLTITGNTMNTSGVLLYVYSNNAANPFLKHVVVENNTINVASADNDIYHGIGYWRNTNDPTFYEYSIKINNNDLPNGRIKIGTPVDASNFNANGGGVFNNDVGAITLPAGIANSGNY